MSRGAILSKAAVLPGILAALVTFSGTHQPMPSSTADSIAPNVSAQPKDLWAYRSQPQ